MKYIPVVLIVVGAALGLLAWGIRFLSGAHGHGLASQDRTAIIVLAVASSASLVAAVILIARQLISARTD